MPGKRRKNTEEGRPIPPHHVRAWRKHRKLTIEQLAELADLSESTISEVETGNQDFTGATLLALANALQTTPGILLSQRPEEGESLYTALQDLRPETQRQIKEIARILKGSGTRD